MNQPELPKGVNQIIRPIYRTVTALAAITLALMMFLSAADVMLRYLFNQPISGGMELVEFMMALLIPLAICMTAYDRAHIKVTIIVERLPQRLQHLIACITSLIGLIFFSLLTWQGLDYTFEQLDSDLTSAVLLIPHYPFIISLTVSFTFLTVITLVHFIHHIMEGISEWTH